MSFSFSKANSFCLFLVLMLIFNFSQEVKSQEEYSRKQNVNSENAIQQKEQAEKFFSDQKYDSAYFYFKKANLFIDSASNPALKAEILLRLCEVNQKLNRIGIALEYGQKALQFLDTHEDNIVLARAYRLIGRSFWYLGKYQPSLKYYLMAKPLYIALKDSMALGGIYNTIGTIQWSLGNYDIALENYKLALKISKALEDNERQARVLNNIGVVYQSLGRWDEALAYHKMAQDIAKKSEKGFGNTYSKINFGIIAMSQGKFNEALQLFQEAKAYFKKLNDPAGLAYIYKYLGDVSEMLDKRDQALEYYTSSLNLGKQIQNSYRICDALFNIGHIYYNNKEFNKAENYVLKSLNIARREGYKKLISNSYEMLAKINQNKQEHDRAYKYLHMAMVLKDSLLNEQKLAAFSDLQLQLALEHQEKENLALRNQNTINILQLRNERLFRHSLMIIILLIVITLGLTLQKWHVSHKLNRILTQQNENIKKINAEKEKLITELKEALENINKLENLLPICSSCKKIRDDEGYWQSVEDYISTHSQIKFSHGLCPDCTKKLYPDIYERMQKRKRNKK